MRNYIWRCFLYGILCVTHFAQVIALHVYLQKSVSKTFFYISLSINGLLYLIDIIANRSAVYIALLSVFSFHWFFIPFLIKSKNIASHISVIIKFIQLVWNSFLFSYFSTQERILPLGLTISSLFISYIFTPLFLIGDIFKKGKKTHFKSYIARMFSAAITSLFYGMLFSINQCYILLLVSLVIRFFFISDHYAFSSSFLSLVDPYYAIILTMKCRSKVLNFLMQIELFVYHVFVFVYLEPTFWNYVILTCSCLCYIILFIFIKWISFAPYRHRIIPYVK